MDSTIATLIGVIVGALTSLLVGFLTGRQQAQLEREKWERARQDELESAIRAAMAEFAKKMAAGIQVIVWITWQAVHKPKELTEIELAQYDKQMQPLFIEIVGARIAVAALSQEFHNQLTPLVNELYALDVEVSQAIGLSKESLEQCIKKLADSFEKAATYELKLVARISAIMGIEQSKTR